MTTVSADYKEVCEKIVQMKAAYINEFGPIIRSFKDSNKENGEIARPGMFSLEDRHREYNITIHSLTASKEYYENVMEKHNVKFEKITC